MPFWLESDTFADEDHWSALAGGRPDLEDRLQAAYCRLKAKASLVRSDGYLTEPRALEGCRGRRAVLDLLCTGVLGQPPLVHRKGDQCDCLEDVWRDGGYAYRIHAFLRRNPARAEHDRKKAMDADRRDHRLRALVYRRDGGCCRYCRSGPLPSNMGRAKDRRKVRSFDHVDPDRPATPDGGNYVVACDRCNVDKDHMTPEEADMPLLPEPTEAERVEWLGRDLQLLDRPDPASTAFRPRSDRGHDRDPDRGPTAIADRGPTAVTTAVDAGHRDDNSRAEVRPASAGGAPDRDPARSSDPPGMGRGAADRGQQSREPPPRSRPEDQPPRTSAHPDIYHRRSRAEPRAGPAVPDWQWPPGSVPASPRRPSDDEEGPSP